MGNVKTINSLKARMVFWRILKVASYLLGFLLLFHLVFIESGNLQGRFFESVKNIPLYYVAGAWAAVIITQLLCALIFKSRMAKIIVIAIIGFAVIAGPLVYLDFFVKPEFDKLAEEYEAEDYEFVSYGKQQFEYPELIEDTNAVVDDFLELYNIKYESKVYGAKNTDLSDYLEVKEGTDVIDKDFFTTDYVFGLSKGDAAYSKNGMYADGYVFGFAQARYIIETYYNTQQKYISEGKDADAELISATTALTTNPASAWNQYKLSDEYLEFYGDNIDEVKNAKRYYVTPERLDAILRALGANLFSGDSRANLNTIIGLLETAGIVDLPDGFLNSLSGNLSLAAVLQIANALGLSFTETQVMGLLEGFSNYQSPQTKPVFYFIEDEGLRDYAYAKYFGEVHGGKVGSVLIGDMVGEITMEESGKVPGDLGELTADLKRTDKDLAYQVKYYPWLVLRNNFLYFCAIIPLSIAGAYLFAAFEKKTLDKLIKGGNK